MEKITDVKVCEQIVKKWFKIFNQNYDIKTYMYKCTSYDACIIM